MQALKLTVADIRKPLRRADMAELFGVTLKTIDNRRKAGELPPSFTSGNERLWLPQDVEAWMAERVEQERTKEEGGGPEAPLDSAPPSSTTRNQPNGLGAAGRGNGMRPVSAFVRRMSEMGKPSI